MMLRLAAVIVLGLGIPAIAAAAPPATGKVGQLPTGVVAPDKALTLFADPASATGEKIELYLVNRTAQAVRVPAQDDDVYAKLEIDRGHGTWARAQSHVFSDCGNSYHVIDLAPGELIHWSAYHPAHGTQATVHYRLYGGLDAVSNAVPGAFDPKELAAAARDALAMRTGDLATLAAVLAPPAPQGTTIKELEQQQTRRAAIERLGQLPGDRAAPLLEQLIAATTDDNEYDQALSALGKVAPARLAALVTAMLKQPASPARDRFVRELPFMPRVSDPAVTADMIARIRDPKSPDLDYLLEVIGGLRTAEVEGLFASITDDKQYPDEVRQRARYLREEWFSGKDVTIRVKTIGNYSDGHKAPVNIDVEIENATKAPIHFAYTAPTELLGVYVTRDIGPRRKMFVSPKRGVAFYAPPAAKPATVVDLAPGKAFTIRIAVMTYFDVHGGDTVWINCKVPGRAVPISSGGGIGINPVP